MAVDSENRDFKFSSQFLTEQDYDFNNSLSNQTQTGSFLGLPSPVESEFGSTEIESDNDDDDNDDKDDDYTAKLSRRMAQYMLQDDDTNNNNTNNNNNQTIPRFGSDKLNKSWGLSGSPISTLWSPLGSSQGSPEGPSKEPSPPTTPMVAENNAFNFSFNFFNQLDKINGPDFATVAETTPKFQKRKQQNFVKQRGSTSAMQAKAQVQGFSSSNAVPSLPKQANSGIKSGLPIGSGSKSGLSGTGVFLPRHNNNSRQAPTPAATPQPQKKKGSSTVLIPVKVLQALQLHYERMDAESRQNVTSSPLHQEPVTDTRNGKNTMKKSYLRAAMTTTRTSTTVSASTSQTDTGLPQEWTY